MRRTGERGKLAALTASSDSVTDRELGTWGHLGIRQVGLQSEGMMGNSRTPLQMFAAIAVGGPSELHLELLVLPNDKQVATVEVEAEVEV